MAPDSSDMSATAQSIQAEMSGVETVDHGQPYLPQGSSMGGTVVARPREGADEVYVLTLHNGTVWEQLTDAAQTELYRRVCQRHEEVCIEGVLDANGLARDGSLYELGTVTMHQYTMNYVSGGDLIQ